MKLSALFIPTIHSIVNATATGNESWIRRSDNGSFTKSMRMPASTITAATTTCPRNCQRARSSSKSSTRPITMPSSAAIAVSVNREERTSSGMRKG